MMRIKYHPFAVEAFFESSIVLTFAVSKEQLQGILPECLELDTFQNKWAFIAVAMVQTKDLRPKGFPRFMGSDFFLIGYRIFVRYASTEGKHLRGLYILKSETDKRKMEFLGNLFTQYKYTTTDIVQQKTGAIRVIRSQKSKFEVAFEQTSEKAEIPHTSPFSTWIEARKFSGPLPFTFSYNDKEKTVLIVEGIRQNWKPQPVTVKHFSFEFINSLKLQNCVLANAFEIKNIRYHWKKGVIEKWK